jgi:mannose-6-phosphate isomerase-like protein (cupin superfamily)/DNA-binding XRE family transcriptional regulator
MADTTNALEAPEGRARADRSGPDQHQLSVLAEELKRHRRQRGFSLEGLAAVSGVSRSMISKIERCEAVPSTTILSRLAEALGVTFSRLMAEPVDREILVIPAARQPVLRDEHSGFVRRCLSPVLPGRGIDWVLNTLPAGGTTGEFVAHRRGVEEYIFVLRGRLAARIGERTVTLETGDSLYFEADAEHAFTNVGQGTCEYFLVIDGSRLR